MTHTTIERLARVLLLIDMVHSQRHSTHSSCRPAVEGAPFKHFCSGTTHSKDRIIIWMKANNDGRDLAKELADCYPGDTKCHLISEGPFEVTAHHNSTSFQSTLLVPKASLDLDHTVFTCKVYDFSQTVAVSTCRLRVYQPPRKASCRVTFVDGEGRVSVTCAVEGVHPNIFCSMPRDQMNFFMNATKVSYSKRCEHHPGRSPRRSDSCLHSCVLNVRVRVNGTYQFKVRIYAQVGHEVQNEIYIEKLTDRVMVRHLPSAKILSRVPSDLDVCPDPEEEQQQPQVFTCQGNWLTSDPKFVWRVHDENSKSHLGNGKAVKTEEITLGNRTTAQSTLEFLPQEKSSSHVKYVSCELRLKDDADKAINVPASRAAQFPVSLRWPPQYPPILTSSKGYVFKERLWIIRGNKETLRCEVKGGRPSVNLTMISCWPAGDDNETLPHISSPGTVAELVFFGELRLNRASCMCSAQHVTGCYRLTSTFDVRVSKNNSSAVTERKEQHAKWVLPLIVRFIVVFAVLGGASSLCFALKLPKKRREQFYHMITGNNSNARSEESHGFSNERPETPTQASEPIPLLEPHENRVTENPTSWHEAVADCTENVYAEISDKRETTETSFFTSTNTTEASVGNQHMGKTCAMGNDVKSDYITPSEVPNDGYEWPIGAQSKCITAVAI